MTTNLQRSIASLLIVFSTRFEMPLPLTAGTVSTEDVIAADQDRIAAMVGHSNVRAGLEARGVNYHPVAAFFGTLITSLTLLVMILA